MEPDSIIATQEDAGQRIDTFLTNRFTEKSRTYFQILIEKGLVLINGNRVKKRMQIAEGDEVEIQFLLTPEITVEAEDIPLDILYEDYHLLAINKPAGMVVHPAPGHYSKTLVNALLGYCQNKLPGKYTVRPGIVHRLDKDTSGVLLAAKTEKCQMKLLSFFYHKKIRKDYLAICIGKPPNGSITLPIGRHPKKRKEMAVVEGGRPAETHFQLLAYKNGLSLVLARPITGRTHQIRVHLKQLGTPILGDPIYGTPNKGRMMLHAHCTKFVHPITSIPMDIFAPIPEEMKKLL